MTSQRFHAMGCGTKPTKAAVDFPLLVQGLVSVATNAVYTKLDHWAASNAYSIKACSCALTASQLDLHGRAVNRNGAIKTLASIFVY